jgi:hypothetical protein
MSKWFKLIPHLAQKSMRQLDNWIVKNTFSMHNQSHMSILQESNTDGKFESICIVHYRSRTLP